MEHISTIRCFADSNCLWTEQAAVIHDKLSLGCFLIMQVSVSRDRYPSHFVMLYQTEGNNVRLPSHLSPRHTTQSDLLWILIALGAVCRRGISASKYICRSHGKGTCQSRKLASMNLVMLCSWFGSIGIVWSSRS